ncbi:hypothetical protein R5W24_000276 [Gemmata sp. JC717]|nr:hypothetical protein [Gemmata algarum]MDY3551201.1 hypothetical protein [Gemmata algarum]
MRLPNSVRATELMVSPHCGGREPVTTTSSSVPTNGRWEHDLPFV